jgi:hypothetical protein
MNKNDETQVARRAYTLYRVFLSAAAAGAVGLACSSSGGPKPIGPGDHFFDSVGTTTGAGAATPIRVECVLFDPARALDHAKGSPGSDANVRAAIARVYIGPAAPLALSGTWSTDGSVTLSGSGWTISGTATGYDTGAIVNGHFQGPMGSGVIAGADITAGKVGVFFGSGTSALSLVVSSSGTVTGVVGGSSGGFVKGTASGNNLSFDWSTDGHSGSGTGTVSTGGQMTGSWQRKDNCSTSQSSGQWRCFNNSFGDCNCFLWTDKGTPPGDPTCNTAQDCCFDASSSGPGCACIVPNPNFGCPATYQGGNRVASCPSGGGTTGPIDGPGCSPQPWQASTNGPAPASPYANYAGTCAAGNLDACTPPPGGCSCPAQGGCTTCGHVSACCIE